jgi:hypothetical protein
MPDRSEDRNVEDVLSSVRRLVSGEIARTSRPRAAPQALVLTPRQRISEARGPIAAQSLEDRIAELEAQLASRQDEWEPDGSEDPATHRPTAPIILPLPDAISAPENRAEDAPRTLRRLSRIELIDTIPEEVSEHADTSETYVEADDVDEADEVRTSAEFDKDLADKVAESVNAVIADITQGDELRDLDPPEPDVETEAEVDADTTDDTAATVNELQVSLEAAQALNTRLDDIDQSATDETPETAPEEPSDAALARPAPANRLEDDLRDLVAQLIREELQGELGARITRNVRKLVRREIQRALATRDLS